MTYDELQTLVIRERDKSRCLSKCAAGLEQNQLRPSTAELIPVTIGRILPTWRVRAKTTAKAEIDACGFEETLHVLGSRNEVMSAPYTLMK